MKTEMWWSLLSHVDITLSFKWKIKTKPQLAAAVRTAQSVTFYDNCFYDEGSMKVPFVKTLNLEISEARNSLWTNNSSQGTQLSSPHAQCKRAQTRVSSDTRAQVFTPYPAVPSDLEPGCGEISIHIMHDLTLVKIDLWLEYFANPPTYSR